MITSLIYALNPLLSINFDYNFIFFFNSNLNIISFSIYIFFLIFLRCHTNVKTKLFFLNMNNNEEILKEFEILRESISFMLPNNLKSLVRDNHEKFLLIFHNTYEPNTRKEIRHHTFIILLKIIDAFMENSINDVMAEYLDFFYNFIDFNNFHKKQTNLTPFNSQDNSKLMISEHLMVSREWVPSVKDSSSSPAIEEALLHVYYSYYYFYFLRSLF